MSAHTTTSRWAMSPKRRLVVNADDFGRSEAINQAIIRAHQEGILTSASLMVNEPAASQAVQLARQNPRLGVGLHLALLCGRSALPPEKIPGLVDSQGQFPTGSVRAGFRYFFSRPLQEQIRAEILAQFEKFCATGLSLDHVNGHLHLHLHPAVLRVLVQEARQLGLTRVRWTFDPFWLNARLASGRWFYRVSHALVFHLLALGARPAFNRAGFRSTHRVFGLLQNACVDENYVLRLLERLPEGTSELYSHPSLEEFRNEFEALISPRVRRQVESLGLELIRYQDL